MRREWRTSDRRNDLGHDAHSDQGQHRRHRRFHRARRLPQVASSTYSNGMMLRLAFAIATVRDPEILAIDEVIGVGDANFFEKAFARLLKLVERSRILVVAAHQDAMLRRICNKAVWLSHGTLKADGLIDEVLAARGDARAA